MRRRSSLAVEREFLEREASRRAAFVEAHGLWLEAVDAMNPGPVRDAELEWNRQLVVSASLWGCDQDPEVYLERLRSLRTT